MEYSPGDKETPCGMAEKASRSGPPAGVAITLT